MKIIPSLVVMPCLSSVVLLLDVPAGAAPSQALHSHVPALAKSLPSLGHFPGTNHLNLAIGLPLRNQAALSNLLQQIYDPASPSYRHYLTPEEFTERFGPTEADYQAVIAFAKANGMQITATHPNRMLVDVEAAVTEVERALHVSLNTYQHPTEHRTFYAPAGEPSLDLSVPVLHISGLDSSVLPRPLNHKMTFAAPNAVPSGSGPNGAFMGNDFRAAYVPGVTLTGAGQNVGLLAFYSTFYQSDITAYETQAGLPDVPIQAVPLDGYAGFPNLANDEVSMDIDMVISMAPGVSKIYVFEGKNGNDILNAMAASNHVKQLSSSWAYGIDATTLQIFQEFAAQGQSFFNASGDYDAWVGEIWSPCDNPFITIVGGTTLTTSGPGGSWVSEKVWNWGLDHGRDGAGSGGGISTIYTIPGWQTNISMASNQGSTTMRNLPDVALTGDYIWVRYGQGQGDIYGGTSTATPLWAGFAALVNQQTAAAGQPPIGFINPALTTIGTGTNYPAAFHDIVAGNNTWSGSPSRFYAVPGYDLCTGWGTPMGQTLIDALADAKPPLLTATSAGGTLYLYWPVSPSGFALESSPDLSPGSWTPVSATPTLSDGQYSLSVQISGTNGFYRLQFPGP